MSLLREPPERIRAVAIGCYIFAVILTIANVACSYFYFRSIAPGGGGLGQAIAIGIAALVNLIETGTTMIFLSADEIGHLFSPPRIPVSGVPALVGKAIKFGILAIFGGVLLWTYKVDLDSTGAVIQARGSIGTFVVVGTVLGSEFLMILGHALWGMAKYSRANVTPMWNSINSMLKGSNVRRLPGGNAGAAPQQGGQPPQPQQQPQPSNPVAQWLNQPQQPKKPEKKAG